MPEDVNKIIVGMLNKLFHDERLDCTNLLTMLEIKLGGTDDDIKEEEIEPLVKIMAVLKVRIDIADEYTEQFYKLRELLEKP